MTLWESVVVLIGVGLVIWQVVEKVQEERFRDELMEELHATNQQLKALRDSVAALGETEQTPRCESRRMSPLPPRVLLIANSAVERSARRQALGRAGFDVETVQTAAEAVEWLAHRQYAAIVTDGYVPDMPPLDWLAALRGVATTTPLVVFVEASRQEELSGHAAEFRAAAVLAPLASPAQLVEAVRAALGPAAG